MQSLLLKEEALAVCVSITLPSHNQVPQFLQIWKLKICSYSTQKPYDKDLVQVDLEWKGSPLHSSFLSTEVVPPWWDIQLRNSQVSQLCTSFLSILEHSIWDHGKLDKLFRVPFGSFDCGIINNANQQLCWQIVFPKYIV